MKQFTCIECPRGCSLSIDEKTLEVTGNCCPRGKKYAVDEVTNPVRIITSTVKLEGSSLFERLPIMSDNGVPKHMMFDVMKEINKVVVKAPVKLHDVVIKNVCNLGINFIATRTIEK